MAGCSTCSTPESGSIAARTAWNYLHQISISAAQREELPALLIPSTLDAVAPFYLEDLKQENAKAAVGSRFLAAVMHHCPSLGSSINKGLLRSARSFKGWQRLVPQQSRDPLPREAFGTILAHLLTMGNMPMVTCHILIWTYYLRPREGTSLLVHQLLPLSASAVAKNSFWFLLVHPVEDGQASQRQACSTTASCWTASG
eukprot:TRINITY_DN2187_c0_g1_i1.p1 TRINITY_DN2187_c0_g1~~TRINITY_DN2187_c0_g1_i1.p1  ORF type:complete len:200 (+),score=28.93 TRINITY_DN2187_c0_g1_i1:318-917(+)